jgi:MFS family permease
MTTAASSLASDAAVRRRDWQIILLIGVAHASSHFFQLVLPSLYVSLGNEFGLDFARLGLLVSTFYVVSGIGQASSGFVVDRIGARPVLWFGLACFVLSGLLIGSATGYPMLMAAAVVGGIGNSVFHPADYSIINHRVTAPRLGHAFSAHGLTGNLGWALTPVFMTSITLLANWRVAAYSAAAL